MEKSINARKQTVLVTFIVFYIIAVIISIHVFNIVALNDRAFDITKVDVFIKQV